MPADNGYTNTSFGTRNIVNGSTFTRNFSPASGPAWAWAGTDNDLNDVSQNGSYLIFSDGIPSLVANLITGGIVDKNATQAPSFAW